MVAHIKAPSRPSGRADEHTARLAERAGVALLAVTVAAWLTGRLPGLTLIDVVVAAVPLAVVPAVGRIATRALPPSVVTATVAAGPLVVLSFVPDRGALAVALAAPWFVVTVVGAAVLGRTVLRRASGGPGPGADEPGLDAQEPTRPHSNRLPLAELAVAAYLAIAAASLVASRAGFTFRHLVEPIVELTAVHYGFAGAGATTIALATTTATTTATRRRLANAALVLVAASSPVVALGFVTRHPLFQVGAAVTLSVGVLGVSYVVARDAAPTARSLATKALLLVAAAAPVVPMALAVAWAADQHWDVPALDVHAMARTHGLANAFGFVGCGLVGFRRLRQETGAW